MNDIQYIVDDKGTKRAVIIDLDKFRDLWEDFYDSLIARSRANEPRESLNTVKKHLSRAGKLNGWLPDNTELIWTSHYGLPRYRTPVRYS